MEETQPADGTRLPDDASRQQVSNPAYTQLGFTRTKSLEEIEEEMERQYIERCQEIERDEAIRLSLEQHLEEDLESDVAHNSNQYGTPPQSFAEAISPVTSRSDNKNRRMSFGINATPSHLLQGSQASSRPIPQIAEDANNFPHHGPADEVTGGHDVFVPINDDLTVSEGNDFCVPDNPFSVIGEDDFSVPFGNDPFATGNNGAAVPGGNGISDPGHHVFLASGGTQSAVPGPTQDNQAVLFPWQNMSTQDYIAYNNLNTTTRLIPQQNWNLPFNPSAFTGPAFTGPTNYGQPIGGQSLNPFLLSQQNVALQQSHEWPGKHDVDPYEARADEIGPTHGIPGIGHIGELLRPPGWVRGEDPFEPIHIQALYDSSRDIAKINLRNETTIENTLNLNDADLVKRSKARSRDWDKQMFLDRFLKVERLVVYEEWMARTKYASGQVSLANNRPTLPNVMGHPQYTLGPGALLKDFNHIGFADAHTLEPSLAVSTTQTVKDRYKAKMAEIGKMKARGLRHLSNAEEEEARENQVLNSFVQNFRTLPGDHPAGQMAREMKYTRPIAAKHAVYGQGITQGSEAFQERLQEERQALQPQEAKSGVSNMPGNYGVGVLDDVWFRGFLNSLTDGQWAVVEEMRILNKNRARTRKTAQVPATTQMELAASLAQFSAKKKKAVPAPRREKKKLWYQEFFDNADLGEAEITSESERLAKAYVEEKAVEAKKKSIDASWGMEGIGGNRDALAKRGFLDFQVEDPKQKKKPGPKTKPKPEQLKAGDGSAKSKGKAKVVAQDIVDETPPKKRRGRKEVPSAEEGLPINMKAAKRFSDAGAGDPTGMFRRESSELSELPRESPILATRGLEPYISPYHSNAIERPAPFLFPSALEPDAEAERKDAEYTHQKRHNVHMIQPVDYAADSPYKSIAPLNAEDRDAVKSASHATSKNDDRKDESFEKKGSIIKKTRSSQRVTPGKKRKIEKPGSEEKQEKRLRFAELDDENKDEIPKGYRRADW